MKTLTPEVMRIALSVMEGLGCSRSLRVAILLRNGEWDQLATLKVFPRDYNDAEAYYSACQATCFLSKYESLPVQNIDKDAKALESWWESERQCKRTNIRLLSYITDPSHEDCDLAILGFIAKVRKEMIVLIGARPPSGDDCDNWDWRFGPGATMSDKSTHTTVLDKMSSKPSLTAHSWPLLRSWKLSAWGRAHTALGLSVREVPGNGYFTVSKTAVTSRSCAKPASINGASQLPVGRFMRKRLLKSGIDLENGQRHHQERALRASLTDDDVTIDIKDASNTQARVLVQLVCTPKWFTYLDMLREHKTVLPDGRVVYNEKFSAMGNGFTFELETAIFCAIARACARDDHEWSSVTVYGDDIICAKSMSENVLAALGFFGFVPNRDKTFTEGPFRESCGGDFFQGVAVRPFYLKEDVNDATKLISIANGLRRVAKSHLAPRSRFAKLHRAWFVTLDFIPSSIRRCRGPQAFGDICIHDDREFWEIKRRDGWECIRTYQPVKHHEVRWEGFAYDVQLAGALYLAGKAACPSVLAHSRRVSHPSLIRGIAISLVTTDKIIDPVRLPNGNLHGRDSVISYDTRWVALV